MASEQLSAGRSDNRRGRQQETALILRYPSNGELDFRKKAEGRLIGLRTNRYSWWVHYRDLADYIIPRRYKWLIAPNQMARGSAINQHILDSAGTIAARNLAAGMMTMCSDPSKEWFKLRIGRQDSTQTSPTSLWLAEVERILNLIFQESNFYDSYAIAYFDLVVFGTAVIILYEDFNDVIRCYNPCAGEYYLDCSDRLTDNVLAREFTYTVDQTVQQFGVENCSPQVQRLYNEGGASLTRELVVAHLIEPNNDGRCYGVPKDFKYREIYWEWGGSASPQGGSSYSQTVLRVTGYHELPFAAPRWDLVSNDAYGRSPGMDALPDIKQLQMQSRRKAQAIDKLVNPPMVADIQLKNQPASLLPGGVTYIAGMTSQSHPGFAPAYLVNPPIKELAEDMQETRSRIGETFYNNLFQTISQYETRSNVTATEIDARRAEAMIMLGPVGERINRELLNVCVERTFAIAARAGIFPPAPGEIRGKSITVDFVSMIELAQDAAQAGGIERVFQLVGSLEGVDPSAIDNVDVDYGVEKYSSLVNNDPKLIRSPVATAQIRQAKQQAATRAQEADNAQKLAMGAKTLSETDIGGGNNALQGLMQGQGQGQGQ